MDAMRPAVECFLLAAKCEEWASHTTHKSQRNTLLTRSKEYRTLGERAKAVQEEVDQNAKIPRPMLRRFGERHTQPVSQEKTDQTSKPGLLAAKGFATPRSRDR